MGTMVHSFFWVVQDLYHQPYQARRNAQTTKTREPTPKARTRGSDLSLRV